ncbi:MAG: L,D-transpeptidase [Chlamydiota bacterium]|nr:L,D-transpeptidase [Chlamydiota bacterium]
MNLPKLFLVVAFVMFSIIGTMALFKDDKNPTQETVLVESSQPIEVEFEQEVRSVELAQQDSTENLTKVVNNLEEKDVSLEKRDQDLPQADRIEELFRKVNPRLPIVETITYKSKVDWLKGRPAWVSDYAGHYKTSRHFIARSLNSKRDYFKQNISLGDRFNVFRLDKEVNFYLVVDTTRSKMWFYYYDKDAGEKVLLKTYDVGLGRVDSTQTSGLLTPLGQYTLGDKVGIYKPKQKGWFNGDKIEMIRTFGTRWIPFEDEYCESCTAPAKGFGIHGAPWVENENGVLVEDINCIGKYESDGCIRLKSQDVEELFSIIITKPTFVILVKDFFDAQVPGVEKR